MTAFSRIQHSGAWGDLVCEIRSINHRYLEINLYLPEAIRALETPIRELMRHHLKRGKIECMVRYQAGPESSNAAVTVNLPLAKALCAASDQLAALLTHAAPTRPADIWRFPGVLETKEVDVKALQQAVLHAIEQGIKDILAGRGREGEELKRLFLQRMETIQHELTKVRARLPQVIADQQERLRKRFAEAQVELDPGRLEQEMVYFVQKIDVAEEIDRTETHVMEVRRVLQEGGLAGRRLDFLLQELNREANTLGSKSVDPEVTHAAVEMKVSIEQAREQVQNIE